MTRVVGAATAVLLLAASAVCAYLAFPSRDEGLVAIPHAADLGELGQGESATAEFELVNRGRSPVEIRRVVKSCDCAEATADKMALAPGEKTPFRVRWSAGAKRGRVVTDVWVFYGAEGGRPLSTQVRLSAVVLPDIEVDKEQLVFEPGKPARQTVVFSPGRLKEYTLRRVYCTQRAFDAALKPGSSAVEVTFDPALWREDHPPASLMVETSSANEPTVEIPLAVAGG